MAEVTLTLTCKKCRLTVDKVADGDVISALNELEFVHDQLRPKCPNVGVRHGS